MKINILHGREEKKVGEKAECGGGGPVLKIGIIHMKI